MTDAVEQVSRANLIFKALASGVRRQVITMLATASGPVDERCCSDEVCACTFAEQLGLGAPTVSHHMKTLLDAGLITAEKRGLWVYYRLAPEALGDITRAVTELAGGGVSRSGTGCSCG